MTRDDRGHLIEHLVFTVHLPEVTPTSSALAIRRELLLKLHRLRAESRSFEDHPKEGYGCVSGIGSELMLYNDSAFGDRVV